MGGKSYFCDYCRCYLRNDLNVRKVHNAGLTHKIAKVTYMRRFEDPRKILLEEQSKQPCTRFLKGKCRFGLYCELTHYSPSQLNELKEIGLRLYQFIIENFFEAQKLERTDCANNKDVKKPKKQRSKRSRLRKMQLKNLPPSLRSTNIENTNIIYSEWG